MTTTTRDSALVFKSEAGDYFILPQGVLERGRVPAERAPELERLVAETTAAAEDDTQGHLFPVICVLAGAAGGHWSAYIIGNTGGDLPAGGWSAGFGDD